MSQPVLGGRAQPYRTIHIFWGSILGVLIQQCTMPPSSAPNLCSVDLGGVKKKVYIQKSCVDWCVRLAGLKYERKRTKRLEKAQERRKKAIERAAPKALNPYASDSDGEAAAEAEESDGEAEEAVEEEEELDDEAWAKAVQSGNLSKGERLVPVDHSTMPYPSFRKVWPRPCWAFCKLGVLSTCFCGTTLSTFLDGSCFGRRAAASDPARRQHRCRPLPREALPWCRYGIMGRWMWNRRG